MAYAYLSPLGARAAGPAVGVRRRLTAFDCTSCVDSGSNLYGYSLIKLNVGVIMVR